MAPSPTPWALLANAFTLLRAVLAPVIGWLLVSGGARWWALGLFGFAALTDALDGWIARRLLVVTRWGQLADPLADKALIVGTMAVLAWLQELPWLAVGVIVVRELAVTLQRLVLVRRGVVMPASVSGKVKTVTQVVAVTLYLLPGSVGTVREIALWTAVGVTVVSGVEYAWRRERLLGG
ncbi:MAG: CDP-diacylglycerol--glycerol-3-phosphate 3-phosphatidyltransferase [Actinomycetota bacterium]|nr:CDP-diacylglycerol--glycerol-3-phosphate 3-phosphatidyltransferase [Actinomycetota bacterium]